MGYASLLWLFRIPGCGKTVLSAVVIEDIDRCSTSDRRSIACFYFDFKESQRQSPDAMVKSLFKQLLPRYAKTPPALEAMSSSRNGILQPSVDMLLTCLEQMAQEVPNPYIVLDALDECADLARLMGIIKRIASWHSVNLLVTSRLISDIQCSLKTFVSSEATICLQTERVDEDIRRYVRCRLSQDYRLNKWQKTLEIVSEIETMLTEKSHGMYVSLLLA